MSGALPVPTAAELRRQWDAFADLFALTFERATIQLAQSLLVQLRLDTASALLEVGAGGGAAASLAQGHLPRGGRHVVSDISPRMCQLARGRLSAPVQVVAGDAEALPFPPGSFDRLLANLNLMLVPDPDRALREARRVLRPGALAGWSVWGRAEESPMFTLPPLAAERAGVALPAKERSNFHLNDRDQLRGRVAAAGFQDVLAWYQAMALPVRTGQEFAGMVLQTPRWRAVEAQLGEAPLARIRAELVALAQAELDRGLPVRLEALMVVARVP